MLDEIGSHLLRLKGKHKFHSNLSISWVLFNSGWYIVLDIPSPKPLFTVPRFKIRLLQVEVLYQPSEETVNF